MAYGARGARRRDRAPRAARVRGRPALGRLDGREEGAAELAAELVPRSDPLARLRAEPLRVGCVGRLLGEPGLDLRRVHLGMELDAPGAPEPERLRCRPRSAPAPPRRRAARACSGATGRRRSARAASRRPDPRGRPRSARPGASRPPARRRRSTSAPAARAISCAPRQTPKSGVPSASRLLEQAQLRPQPAVPGVLVGVHRAAEDEHRVGLLRPRARDRHPPLDELVARVADRLAEDARADARAVCEREHPHPTELKGRMAPWTSGRSACSTPAWAA